MYKVIVTDDAKADLQKAYDYLETERKGLGENLLLRIEHFLELLQSNPKIYAFKYKNTRQVRVKPFQYLILYKLYGNTILFFQLFHGKQHPSKKKKADTLG